MIYHKNFHFHCLEIPSIYHLLSSILFYHYFMQKSITLLLHFLYIYITSPKKWKFFWKKLEIQFPIYGNKIGNIWKRNWKKLEMELEIYGNHFPENGNTSGKNWKFPIFSNSKAKICSGG